ncbi:YkgJ family cysteine cluster protein [Litoribacter ruber]|uniref:YkgJ family cysteine cluster protein n=1 Tax=Litoribacter ruber TaxID=702568 RepID=UPI001FEBDEFC|nr:YkgJ family cysteine cluster protein [Litoribacter alkaliphilus]
MTEGFENISRSEYSSNKKLKDKLRKVKPKELDQMFHREHENSFREIDCLSCANCCKTTSPIFISTDIERISKTLKMKTGEFIDTYLRMDEEGDYVLQKSPCSFLLDDNTCLIYEDRPKACREYPHTDRKNMTGILALTLRNTLVCPAVLRIFQVFSREFRK